MKFRVSSYLRCKVILYYRKYAKYQLNIIMNIDILSKCSIRINHKLTKHKNKTPSTDH